MNKLVNKVVVMSLVLSPFLMAETVQMEEIEIDESSSSVILNDISSEELKSADLAESLSRIVPSVSMVRRSGISNDIILRGQKKDNINIIIDGAKIYGAGPNRMDPPTSHVLTNNIESIEIKEGPYDVSNFGTLSGLISVKTKQPTEDVSGEVNGNIGSFGYQKVSATVSGGYEKFRVLLSASTESSDQYKDGNGDTLSQQVDNSLGNPLAGGAYQPQYKDMKAYEKKAFIGKFFYNPTDDQELRFSYTANRSDDILYPSTPMDANSDDSDIFNLEYSISRLGTYSKKLDFQYYNSSVDHPMSNKYRNASTTGPLKQNNMKSNIQGAKITNLVELAGADVTYGLDSSIRNWEGFYTANGNYLGNSIDETDTSNIGLFTRAEKSFGAIGIDMGLRFDDTKIKTTGTEPDNDYQAVSGYVFTTLNTSESMQYFFGAGKATRVPDARELYFKAMNGTVKGTPTLDQTSNYELDLGLKKQFDNAFFKAKVFHSWLQDYIVFNADSGANAFENVNATIYGVELTGFYALNDELSFDMGIAYARGEKDEPLSGQSDTDLAEIPPLKLNAAAHYDTDTTSSKIELVAADEWKHFDSDNGEQKLSGYAIMNLRFNAELIYGFDLTVGVDNILDDTYAVSNTYKDLTLLASGTTGEVMLLNEPGRYFYTNLRYKF